jgi:probable F420-dependent oxidoreductase
MLGRTKIRSTSPVKVGVIFPQTEIGNDPSVIKDFVQAVEELGYDHLVIFDHVLGADANRTDRPRGPYTHDTAFHEPFVLYGYLAAVTQRIELVTGVIILPQRQTALVAKQAAEIDILSGGRLRLGVGTGWNAVEYEALNEDFHNRGKRQEEQIQLMRKLWSEPLVNFEGKWHHIDGAGLKPLPGRQIPIWFGGRDEHVIERAARIGDGWLLNQPPGDHLDESLARLRQSLRANGRDPKSFGIEGFTGYGDGDLDRAGRQMEAWAAAGATHISVNVMNAGLESPSGHLDAIRRYREIVK